MRLIDAAGVVAPEFGPNARRVISAALDELGVETVVGVRVSRVDPHGVNLEDGHGLIADWLPGLRGPRASSLDEQLGVELDSLGRVTVDAHMATGVDGVWVAGDSARAIADGEHDALMSCQHAMPQGSRWRC